MHPYLHDSLRGFSPKFVGIGGHSRTRDRSSLLSNGMAGMRGAGNLSTGALKKMNVSPTSNLRRADPLTGSPECLGLPLCNGTETKSEFEFSLGAGFAYSCIRSQSGYEARCPFSREWLVKCEPVRLVSPASMLSSKCYLTASCGVNDYLTSGTIV